MKIGVGLYIVRNEAEKDLFSVLEQLKAIGYDGVEFVGFFGRTPDEIRKKLDELGMKALGDHVPVDDFMENPQKVLDDHLKLGCKYLTIAWSNRKIRPGTADFSKMVENMKFFAQKCYEVGITPLYHNHDFEYEQSPSFVDLILDECKEKEERLCFEPDLGWMAFKQADPIEYLKKYQDRCPVIHLKDVYAEDFSKVGTGETIGTNKADPDKGYFEFRPTGYGLVDMPRVMPYCLKCNPDWLMVDHDLAYERNSFEDLKWSYDYIKNLLKIAR